MNIKVIGIGAAGNKAAVTLVEKGILTEDKILLINSTFRDVPEDYRHKAIQFSGGNGCGKEREVSKQLFLNSLKFKELDALDNLIEDTDDLAIIVSSTAGGTGSGSAPMIAKYLLETTGIAVQCFAFTGFEDDGRELQNTIEYFQEMEEDFIVQSISNSKFLPASNNNKLKAEILANEEFAKRIEILIAKGIVDSSQNIDETDLFKVVTTPGYMTISSVNIENIKNVDQLNKAITEMLDDNKSLDISEKGIKRLAVFLNIPEKLQDFIDYKFTVIMDRLGIPYEKFYHIQYNPDMDIQLSFIASGMKMPIDEVKYIYDRYIEESNRVNKKKDTFYEFASELRGNNEDAMFNVSTRKRKKIKSKDAFLDSMLDNSVSNTKISNTTNNSSSDKEVKTIQKNKDDFVKNNF